MGHQGDSGAATPSGENAKRPASLVHRYDADVSLEDRVAFLTDELIKMEVVRDWKQAVKAELSKSQYSLDEIQRTRSSSSSSSDTKTPLYRIADTLGLVASLKRVIIDLHCETSGQVANATRRQAKEEEASLIPETLDAVTGCSLDVVMKARENWEKITREELLRFASEQGKPLMAPAHSPVRTPLAAVEGDNEEQEDDGMASLPANLAPTRSYKPPPSTRFLYDGNDLLHTLQAIKSMNRSVDTTTNAPLESWNSIQLFFHSLSTHELRRRFVELAPGIGQIGVDELFPVERQAFLTEKNRIGDLVVAHHSVSMARQYAKTGCPTILRCHIWRQALAVAPSTSTEARQYFTKLQDQVSQWTYVTDDMYLMDLQRAIDSSDYFVFQDLLDSAVMAFTRDGYVLDRACQVNGAVQLPPQQKDHAGRGGTEKQPMNDFVPPNGVLPFNGLVLYVAPLAYIYQDDAELYFVFREMYVRYWSHLNAIRGEPSTILPLCKLFEDLVIRSSTSAVFHLLSIGIKPLDVAFPWIQTAFSGVVQIHQLLLLWDRVVGYDSLELLAVFAAALFHFRADEFHNITTMDDIRGLYSELLDLQVIPLLQEYLFLLT